MAGVSLPQLPRGREFEDLVAATFQSSGLFVERDLTQREEVDVLQLDAVTTDYSAHPPLLRLIEAKSGGWGLSDVFKIRGWMAYLNISAACLITSAARDKFEAYERLSQRIGVQILRIPDPARPGESLGALMPAGAIDPVDVAMWRFTYWAERNMLEWVRIRRQTQPAVARFAAIMDHAFEITSGVFFTATIAERVESLYRTYGQYRNLAGRCGQEIVSGAFGEESTRIPESVFAGVFYRCVFNEVQVACFLEHWARLMLLKAAVDYLSYKADGEVSRAERSVVWRFGKNEYKMPLVTFPKTFEDALESLSTEPHYRRYPVFWQWFLGPFGGFILKEYESQEVERLARKAGMPPEAVPDAFAAFDKLFPREGGWFWEQGESNTRGLILYPAVLKGIGANYRRLIYCEDGKYESLKLNGRFTLTDLLKWTKATIGILVGGES